MGGFGGDWDTLAAEAPFAGDDEVRAIMEALCLPSDLLPGAGHTDLGPCEAAGVDVRVTVDRSGAGPGAPGVVRLLAAVYVTDAHVVAVGRLEDWLDARGVRLAPSRRSPA